MAGIARTPAAVAAASLAVIALAAGCTGNTPAPAGPGTTTRSGTSLVVPAVSNPLDVSGFRDAPCRLIPERQARDLGRPVAQEERTGSRVACHWRPSTDSNPMDFLDIVIYTGDGLAGIARQCRSQIDCDSWTVDTIAGYPVVRANGRRESKYGFCKLFVGVADDVEFMVADSDVDGIRKGTAEGSAGGPRCDRADHAATIVIQTLKDGR
ncbi:MAG TPA: DUF3558 family protein [Actinophytocola sp.]|uniref:DUF3558 family protein n=1 Tax=Actinophytocola sp. TaxID=1872138 RepID=UPI002E0CA5DE|nr:DUF3558 family protein [Actinophytocola sp.]